MRKPWLTRLSNCIGIIILLEGGSFQLYLKLRFSTLSKLINWNKVIPFKHLIADQLDLHIIDRISSRLFSLKYAVGIDKVNEEPESTSRITYFKHGHNDSLELIPKDSMKTTVIKNNSTTTTVENVQESIRKPKAVIISAFMRSGSSLVGEVFNSHPDVFYSFEPLHGSVQWNMTALIV